MNTFKKKLIFFHSCPNVTRPLIKRALAVDPQLSLTFSSNVKQLSTLLQIPMKRANMIYHHIQDPNIMKKLDKTFQRYPCITIFDDIFPSSLKCIPDPPYVLYLAGNPSLLNTSRLLSVVGTRTPSEYALPAMKRILVPIIQAGFTIVSGMAIGVDQLAHELAVRNSGATIAVLGSGFDHVYPKNNIPLYHQLINDQLVISEYPPYFPPKKYYFPERNRIISGLATSTFVVEARLRSGSLITVDQALEQGKEIYAMPGPVGSPTSEGCHAMIQQGAKLVQTCNDILEDW